MSTDIVTVQLKRDNEEEKWGFQISGGKDQNSPLVISEVRTPYFCKIKKLDMLPGHVLLSCLVHYGSSSFSLRTDYSRFNC